MKRGYNPGTHKVGCQCFACPTRAKPWNTGRKTGPQSWSKKRLESRARFLSDPVQYAAFIEKCRANGIKSALSQGRRRSSCPEHYVRGFLDALGVDYVYQYPAGGVMLADFYVPSHNLVLEYDGSFWHRSHAARDADRDARLSSLGYRVLRVTEKTLERLLCEEFAGEIEKARKEALS